MSLRLPVFLVVSFVMPTLGFCENHLHNFTIFQVTSIEVQDWYMYKLDHTLARKNDSPTWCGVIVVVWCYCGGVVLLW